MNNASNLNSKIYNKKDSFFFQLYMKYIISYLLYSYNVCSDMKNVHCYVCSY